MSLFGKNETDTSSCSFSCNNEQKAHSKSHHLPILIPIVHDEDLDEINNSASTSSSDGTLFDDALLRKDLAQKKKLLNHLLSDCKVVIRMSEVKNNSIYKYVQRALRFVRMQLYNWWFLDRWLRA